MRRDGDTRRADNRADEATRVHFSRLFAECVGDLADHVNTAALARRRVQTIERLRGFDRSHRPARVDAVRIDHAAVVPGCDGRQAPLEIEPVGGLIEQLQESPRDVAESDQGEGEFRLSHARR